MSWSFVASSVLSAMPHIRKAGLTSHWSLRCGVWFSCWLLQMSRCFWAWRKLLLPCRFWLWRLGLCLPVGQSRFLGRRKTPPPWWALHQLWLVRWQLCSFSSARSSSCWSWALSLLMWSPADWSCPASGCDCVTGASGHQRSRGRLAASRVSTVPTCCSSLHDPVDDQEEEEWRKQAPLPNSSLHPKTFRQLAGVGNSAAHVPKGAPDEGDYLLGDSTVSQ